MLVLSRQPDETIVFPGLGISLQVLRCTPNSVKIGIEAPREIAILRGELADKEQASGRFIPPVEKIPQALLPSLQATIHEAAACLNRLHALTQDNADKACESEIIGLYGYLQKLDSQVTALKSTQPQASTPPAGRPLRALLVDDNDNECKLLSSYLRLKGIEVTTASDGQVAMQRIAEEPTDIVLLDMTMPRFDGRWTINQIRHQQSLENLPVFAVSGIDPAESDVEVGPHGVNGWFRKPLNPDDLIREMTNSCRHSVAVLN